MTDFPSLGLAQPILQALDEAGYTVPTPIQQQAIPIAITGRDLLGIAQTGTGKTAAFALPILHRLIGNPAPRHKLAPRVLVLAPTRELASQIAEQFRIFSQMVKLTVQTVFGGTPISRQERQLARGIDVLVATPGRLLDLVDRGSLLLDRVEILVLDEADQMLDLGFIHALRRIERILPRQRQSLFFSATMPASIAELSSRFCTNPARVEATPVATTAERVSQYVTFLNQAEKQALLTLTLRQPEFAKCLVFTRTKHGADRVVRHLAGAGIPSAAIHGNKSQPHRERALSAFRHGEIGVLVATDIAARGIDIDAVSHVINFELPNVPEQYVHRIGRTARAGREGVALSFCAPDEKAFLRDIEKLIKQKVDPRPLPADFLKQAAQLPKPLPAPAGEERPNYTHGSSVGTHRRAMRPDHNGARRGPAPQAGRSSQGRNFGGQDGQGQGEGNGGHYSRRNEGGHSANYGGNHGGGRGGSYGGGHGGGNSAGNGGHQNGPSGGSQGERSSRPQARRPHQAARRRP